MASLSDLNSYGEELEKRLRLKTFPLAVKLLEKEEDIPEGAIRPKRDLGYHLALCQGFAIGIISQEMPKKLLAEADFTLNGVTDVERFLQWLSQTAPEPS